MPLRHPTLAIGRIVFLLPLFLSEAWLVIGDIVPFIQIFNYVTYAKLIKSRCFAKLFYMFIKLLEG